MDPVQNDLNRLKAEYARRESRLAGSDIYSLLNPANLFLFQSRQREELKLLRRYGFDGQQHRRILELGCGKGAVLLTYLTYGAEPKHLHGMDLLYSRLSSARRCLPHLPLACADGQRFPYAAGTFDLILQYTVFSSILDDGIKARLAHEMLRVLCEPHGTILWYDFWLNPTNPQTRGIRPAEIRRLFPGCQFEFHRITLAPPLARHLVPVSWSLAHLLEKLQVLNTHYLVAIRKTCKQQKP